VLAFAAALHAHAAAAQQKLLTLDDIYGPGADVSTAAPRRA
jgi:hypothetical protein